MNRPILATDHIHPAIRDTIAQHQQDIVTEVQQAVQQHAVVVVGMAQNPMVTKARKALAEAGFGGHLLPPLGLDARVPSLIAAALLDEGI